MRARATECKKSLHQILFYLLYQTLKLTTSALISVFEIKFLKTSHQSDFYFCRCDSLIARLAQDLRAANTTLEVERKQVDQSTEAHRKKIDQLNSEVK